MSNVLPRRPWVCDRWDGNLLILGESHYVETGKDAEDPEMTVDVVTAVVDGTYRLRFFTWRALLEQCGQVPRQDPSLLVRSTFQLINTRSRRSPAYPTWLANTRVSPMR